MAFLLGALKLCGVDIGYRRKNHLGDETVEIIAEVSGTHVANADYAVAQGLDSCDNFLYSADRGGKGSGIVGIGELIHFQREAVVALNGLECIKHLEVRLDGEESLALFFVEAADELIKMSIAMTCGDNSLLGTYRVFYMHIGDVGLEQLICGENVNAVENIVRGVENSADDIAELLVEIEASLGDIAVNTALVLVAAEDSALL